MAKLHAYSAKRRFEVTSEPPAGGRVPRPQASALSFVVHKHHARRLHYDLRHPSFKRLRDDKSPDDAVRERPRGNR